MAGGSSTSAGCSFICTTLILTAIGISYLVRLDFQSTHQGELIRAWDVYGSKNNYYVMEQFQYGEFKNHTCLIRRTTARTKKKTQKVAKRKKRGTTRKIWVYKDGHCTDSRLRDFLLRSGIGYLVPMGLVLCCLFLICCATIFSPSEESNPTASSQISIPVPQSEPPKDSVVTSNEVEVEVEMTQNDKYQEEDAPPPV